MKKLLFLPLIIAAFFSALAFRYVLKPAETARQNQSVLLKKLKARKIISSLDCRSGPVFDPDPADIPVLTGWGNHEWKISTKSDSAQVYFNQGINLYYAFHTGEARASFVKAIRFDSSCAMAWYGYALSLGPNINFGNAYRAAPEAYQAAERAGSLSSGLNETDRDLIAAIHARYSADSAADLRTLQRSYTSAMKALAVKYNRNAEIQTLYADAMMLEHPWDLYDGTTLPKPWTGQILDALKKAFAIDSLHPGANHFLVHALEGSAHPEQAMNSAEILAGLMPDVSHIVHMPSHIYIRTGGYAKGIDVNDRALTAYNKYVDLYAPSQEGQGFYQLHAIHMKAACGIMAGSWQVSIHTSDSIRQLVPREFLDMPGPFGNYVQYVNASRLFSFIRFGQWDSILHEPEENIKRRYGYVLDHFARGMARSRLKRMEEAEEELTLMRRGMLAGVLRIPNDPNSSAYDAALVAEGILEGTIAQERGRFSEAKRIFQKAVRDETAIIYNEPRDWILPARQYLGNLYLKMGDYRAAVSVFEEELRINPKNGWSLTGLRMAYAGMQNQEALPRVDSALKEAWSISDVKISGPVF